MGDIKGLSQLASVVPPFVMVGLGTRSKCVGGHLVNGQQRIKMPTTYPQVPHYGVERVNPIVFLSWRNAKRLC